VAADDGVKPQTLEAIDHSRAAGVPIVVAINKIDKPGADQARVKQQLADREILVEEYGGDVVACEVSAKTKDGLDHLMEMVLLVADMLELKASPDKVASGVILEARLDKARGVISTVLIQDGTLKVGNPFIAGAAHGKVRAMLDQNGHKITEAGPATPVEIMGLATEPNAGDLFQAVATEAKARQIAGFRQEKMRATTLAKTSRRSLESLSREIAEGHVKDLPILLKSDVQGSIEAIRKALNDLPDDKIKISIIRASTGAISQADVLLASAANAIIVGFNVRPSKDATEVSKHENVEIRTYTVIYDMIDEITQAMIGLLEPDLNEVVLGQAQVREQFKVPKVGIIAGCYVSEGKVTRNAEVRLLRDNVIIHTGKVGSLRRFKDDAAEVKQGYECGIGIDGYNDIKEGDVIEFFVMEKVAVKSL
jgi:translation initiation factor IF-2